MYNSQFRKIDTHGWFVVQGHIFMIFIINSTVIYMCVCVYIYVNLWKFHFFNYIILQLTIDDKLL